MISTHSVNGGGIMVFGAVAVAVAVDVDVDVDAVDREWLSSLSGVTDFKLILTRRKVTELRSKDMHQSKRPLGLFPPHCSLHSGSR